MDYRILLGGNPYDATNFGEISINLDLNTDDGGYFFRRSLSGDLRFFKAAYNFILSQIQIGQCEKITVEIQQRCEGAWETVIAGFLSRFDCTINYDGCYMDVSINITDEYTCIINNADNGVNFLDYPVRDDFPYSPIYGLQATTGPISPSPPGYGVFYGPVGSLYIYARYVVQTDCVAGIPQEPPPAFSTWNLEADNCAIDGTSTWWREVTPAEVFLDIYTEECINLLGCDPPLCGLFCVDAGVVLIDPVIGRYLRYCVCPSSTQFWLPNGRKLTDAIDYMLGETCPDLTLQSELLTDNTNYVTGQTPNNIQDLYLFQKSDIVRATATEVATDGSISIRDLMADLSAIFNAFWYVDGVAGKLIFEHVSAILSTIVGIDLTALDGGKWDVGRKSIAYDGEEIPKSETFSFFAPSITRDFKGLPIVYNADCAKARTIETRLNNIDTELVRIFQNPNESLEGFFLMAAGSILQDDQYTTSGVLSGLFIPNAPLSWANLHDDYFRDYRYMVDGDLNGVPTVFNSTRPIIRQENIIFPLNCLNDFNPLDLVKTSIGDGRVVSAVYELSSKKIQVVLKHEDI